MYLGIDIGGTSIKFAVFDDNYKIIHYETCKTPDNVSVKLTTSLQLEFLQLVLSIMYTWK